jgi:hypothetical protein
VKKHIEKAEVVELAEKVRLLIEEARGYDRNLSAFDAAITEWLEKPYITEQDLKKQYIIQQHLKLTPEQMEAWSAFTLHTHVVEEEAPIKTPPRG